MRWIVGDIHGLLRPLRALLGAVRAADPAAQFLFVGDYVNRGPDAKGVLDLLTALPGARFVRGNHDDVLDLILNGRCYDPHPDAQDPVLAFTWFVRHGLRDTLHSYGVDDIDIDGVLRRPSLAGVIRLFEPVPLAHRAFLRNLPAVIEEDTFFVLHAQWNVDDPDQNPSIAEALVAETWLRHQVLWGRYGPEVSRVKRWRRTGYFGHTPVENYPMSLRTADNVPIRGPGIVLLDTAAALSPRGRLSAVCADSGRLIQVDRVGEVVPQR